MNYFPKTALKVRDYKRIKLLNIKREEREDLPELSWALKASLGCCSPLKRKSLKKFFFVFFKPFEQKLFEISWKKRNFLRNFEDFCPHFCLARVSIHSEIWMNCRQKSRDLIWTQFWNWIELRHFEWSRDSSLNLLSWQRSLNNSNKGRDNQTMPEKSFSSYSFEKF